MKFSNLVTVIFFKSWILADQMPQRVRDLAAKFGKSELELPQAVYWPPCTHIGV